MDSDFTDMLFTIISRISDIEVYFLSFLVAIAFSKKEEKLGNAYLYFSLVSMIWVLKNFTKLLYQSPRPYMTSVDVRVLTVGKCEQEFGSPSGHSTQSAAFSVFLVLDLIDNTKGKLFGMLGSILYFGLVGFSRLYLGLHTWN